MAEDRYVELVEHGLFNRGKIVKVSDVSLRKREHAAYTSIYRFGSDFLDYTNTNIKGGKPSVENYLGSCSASYLWLDIDIEGRLEEATQIMVDIVNSIDSKYGITYRSLAIYFSGSKGYHIGIPSKCFGAEEYYGDLLPSAFKSMAIQITDNSPVIDKKVYNTTRLFRIPFSKHNTSLYYKIPIDFILIQEQGIMQMLSFAEQGKAHMQYKSEFQYSDKLKKLFDDCISAASVNVDLFTDVEGYTKAMSLRDNSSIFRLPDKGERNDLIYKMAYRLFCVRDLKLNEITDILKFVYELTNEHSSKNNWSRLTEMELKLLINSAYSRTRLKQVKKVKAENFTSMVLTMYKQILNSKYIPTFCEEISQDLHGGYEMGNVYCLIGRGGSMKSYLMQEEIIRTVLNKSACVIFNLEMSQVTLFDRIWTALFSKSLFSMITEDNISESQVLVLGESVKEMVENYLHISNETDIEPSDIEVIAKQKQDEIKHKIHLIGIDSVNGLRDYGNEAETARKISKYVKEVAKELYCPVLLINHANSSCPNTLRDASDYVRGGQKFVDNADSHFSFSKIVDKELSNLQKDPPDYVFKKGYIYCRFYNKRGSGTTINKIIRFMENGRVQALPDNPIDYEVGGYSGNPF